MSAKHATPWMMFALLRAFGSLRIEVALKNYTGATAYPLNVIHLEQALL
jgi:hypothetical protein